MCFDVTTKSNFFVSIRLLTQITYPLRRKASELDVKPMSIRTKQSAKPFIKWAGGKTNLLSVLGPLVPKNYVRYIEPFVGGGAFFFNLQPSNSLLSDSNEELINCYLVVRDNPEELMATLKTMSINEKHYYAERAKNPKNLTELERAARFIYLNKTCYNGLYRVNKKGKFNTPFGHYTKVNLYNSKELLRASLILKNTMIITGDFEQILLKHAQKNDFIYLDPPYQATSRFSDFKRYTKNFFDETEQVRLAKIVKKIDDRGCKFILSNAKHPLISKLYLDDTPFRNIDVYAPRFINCRGGKRGKVPEVLITNITLEETADFSSNKIHGQQTKITELHV